MNLSARILLYRGQPGMAGKCRHLLTVPVCSMLKPWANASHATMVAMSLMSVFVSFALAEADLSWLSFARAHGCDDTFIFEDMAWSDAENLGVQKQVNNGSSMLDQELFVCCCCCWPGLSVQCPPTKITQQGGHSWSFPSPPHSRCNSESHDGNPHLYDRAL